MNQGDGKRIRLGELLLRAGVISEDQLRAALTEQKKWGGKLGTTLVEMRVLDEDLLVKALSRQLGLPRIDFKGLRIPPEALAKLEAEFSQARQVLPIAYDAGRKQLVVAMADPDNLSVVDEIAFRTGCRVKVAIAGERALAAAIREAYFGDNVLSPETQATGESMNLLSTLGDQMVPRDEMPPAGATPTTAPPPVTIEERLRRMELLQQKEIRILKTVVELLIEKGFITHDEYRKRVER